LADVTDVAFFTSNGLEGTWRYIFKADFRVGVVFDVDSEVNMAGGEGTLVFGGRIDILDAGSASWTDTVDLRLRGSRAMEVNRRGGRDRLEHPETHRGCLPDVPDARNTRDRRGLGPLLSLSGSLSCA
jgi:hypothetical protein